MRFETDIQSLPTEFTQRLKNIVADVHWHSVVHSFTIEKHASFRVNRLEHSVNSIRYILHDEGIHTQNIEWNPIAFVVDRDQRQQTLETALYQNGMIYSQNLSSQLAPIVLQPQPGEEILDLCAAPGGKTLQIAYMMQEQGRIAAVEKAKARFYKLKANIKLQGSQTIKPYWQDGSRTWRKTPERFDRVLLDAPCSSESRFSTLKPDSHRYWSRKKIKQLASQQKQLLYSAVQCLKPGGTLVYSTCSFAPEENEANIDYILRRFTGKLQLQNIALPIDNQQNGLCRWQNLEFNPNLTQTVRILPNDVMDGFYIAKLGKLATTLE